ncbi:MULTISPECIES: YceI family protein [unclassified Polaribacter]|uniref:YceI family protein n=1 Tax=unclassified Polaribacter TaxID=196858 RepID=UPI000068C747|nr:YceI family protein [Polaribacter sp. MED152]EAQ42460.1 YceI like family protein [Polaribacter sp. MED152]
MKKLQLFTAISLFISMSISAQKFNLESKNSNISWTGKAAFNAYALTGSLKAKSGEILIENDSIKKLEVIIDMKSLDHSNKDLKKHLRNKDFFEVKKYQTATFKLLNSVKLVKGKILLVGNMTIKNITKKEEIEVEIHKNENINLQFTTNLDRTKYGVKFNSPSFFKKMKENAIADEFVLKSELTFN